MGVATPESIHPAAAQVVLGGAVLSLLWLQVQAPKFGGVMRIYQYVHYTISLSQNIPFLDYKVIKPNFHLILFRKRFWQVAGTLL